MIRHVIKHEDYIGELGYLKLLNDVLVKGKMQNTRAGNALSIFDGKLKFNIDNPPIFCSRQINYRYSFEEFWFFLQGKTQTNELEEKGIKFWKGNTSRQFLDDRGLTHLDQGDMGKAYGYQLRHFNDNTDQIANLIDTMNNDINSRRLLVTMWNPGQEHEMALPPCWHSHQFVVIDGVLNLKVINRSLDILYGAPFAIFQYWVYLNVMASVYKLKVGELSCDLSHIHIYENQIEYVKEYFDHVDDNCLKLLDAIDKVPLLTFTDDFYENIKTMQEAIDKMEWSDIKILDHTQLKFINKTKKPEMAI